MSRLRLLLGIAVILVPLVATARDGQPTQQWLSVDEQGEWMLTRQYIVTVCMPETYVIKVKIPYQVSKEVVVNGKVEQQTVTQYKEEERTAQRMKSLQEFKIARIPVDQKSAKAFETDGKAIPIADVAKRCSKGALVVVSPTSEMIATSYAGLFKQGTVILALAPQQYAAAAPVPHGVPAPRQPDQAPTAPAAPAATGITPLTTIRPAAYAPSHGKPDLAPTLAPELVFVSRDGADGLKIRQLEEIATEVEVTYTGSDSSVAQESVIKAQRISRRSWTSTVPLKAVRVSFPSEGTLSQDKVKEKLGQGETAAVLSSDGTLVDEFWLQNLKPSVLVIRGIKIAPDMPGAMPAMPPMPVPVPRPGSGSPKPDEA